MKINDNKTYYFLFFLVSYLFVGCQDSKEKKEFENIQKGKQLFTSVGCATCHSITGEKRYGPKLNDILGTETKVIRNGKQYTFTIDRNYIKKAIADPDYEKPLLYKSNKMPKPNLTDHEVDCITNYLISIHK